MYGTYTREEDSMAKASPHLRLSVPFPLPGLQAVLISMPKSMPSYMGARGAQIIPLPLHILLFVPDTLLPRCGLKTLPLPDYVR